MSSSSRKPLGIMNTTRRCFIIASGFLCIVYSVPNPSSKIKQSLQSAVSSGAEPSGVVDPIVLIRLTHIHGIVRTFLRCPISSSITVLSSMLIRLLDKSLSRPAY